MGISKFFYHFSIALCVGSILIFGLHALILPNNVSKIHPLMLVHACAMYAWYGLLVVQAGLIRRMNYSLHKRLGFLSIVVALAVLVTGVMITIYGFKHSRSMLFFSGNSLMLLFFTIFYTLALAYRKNGDTHKRLIIFSSIAVYIPVAFRAAALIGDRKYASIVYILLILVIPLWELLTPRKITKITSICTVSLILMVVFTFVLAKNPAFTSFVHEIFGIPAEPIN